MHYNNQYANALECLNLALAEEVRLRDPMVGGLFYQFILKAKINIRPYYMGADVLRNEIWAPIRSNEALLDLVMKASTNFEMRMQLREDCDFTKLVEYLSKTMGGRSSGTSSIVDQDFATKVIGATSLREFMVTDSWLAFVFFAMLNVSILVRYEVAVDADESGSKDTN
jgi:hypothetical protein